MKEHFPRTMIHSRRKFRVSLASLIVVNQISSTNSGETQFGLQLWS